MSEETRKEWEYFKEKVIPAYIDRLSHLEEQKSDLDKSKKDIVLELADRCEKYMASDEIARFLVKELKGTVEKAWIERILGKTQKRHYERYQDSEMSNLDISNKENTVQVSTSGSQSVTGPDGNEREQEVEQMAEVAAEDIATKRISEADEESDVHDAIAERSAEIALNTIESKNKEVEDAKIRLNEAFHLIEDKDSVIQKLRVELGNLEIEVGELKRKKPLMSINKVDDTKEDLQIQLDEAKQTIIELRQIEAIHTRNQDFSVASKVASPSKVWIAAINASGLTRALVQITMKAARSSLERKKVLFDVTDEGQLKNPRLEGV